MADIYKSQTLEHQPSTRRNALSLSRDAVPTDRGLNRSRRMSLSLSPWSTKGEEQEKWGDESQAERKGIWSWKPIRTLTHLTMQKLSCLFSVEVVAVQGLPPSMNGTRLAVCVRKKESKDGSAQTMPSRVSEGAADFEETLFVRCHVYFTPGSGIRLKFEPRPFLVYVVSVDAPELEFGRTAVDLSALVQDSIARSFEGTRIKEWDKTFFLSGKAEGGELVLKLGFQIMEKGGGILSYSQAELRKPARRQSRISFSVATPTPRLTSRSDAWSRSEKFSVSSTIFEEMELPEFDIVDKGVEIEVGVGDKEQETSSDKRSMSREVVKEVVSDQFYSAGFSELDSMALHIRALESMMEKGIEESSPSQALDSDEDKVRRKFLKLLEGDDQRKVESEVSVPDLGKGLGCVVQTRNGGFLVALNPMVTPVAKNDAPKLAMQLSKPVAIPLGKASGFDVFREMAALGLEEFTSEIQRLMPADELSGKTAEQVAFEGIASAIILGRKKDGATSRAMRTIATVKSMARICNAGEDHLAVDDILPFSLQKIGSIVVEALKIQAGVAEAVEKAPLVAGSTENSHLSSAVPVDDWIIKESSPTNSIAVSVAVQLRDPTREYEAVGGPMIALIHAMAWGCGEEEADEEKKYKVVSVRVGGVKVGRNLSTKTTWDGEKQKLTALQWLLGHGLVKAGSGKKAKRLPPSNRPDIMWSLSARVAAGRWLKPERDFDLVFNR